MFFYFNDAFARHGTISGIVVSNIWGYNLISFKTTTSSDYYEIQLFHNTSSPRMRFCYVSGSTVTTIWQY